VRENGVSPEEVRIASLGSSNQTDRFARHIRSVRPMRLRAGLQRSRCMVPGVCCMLRDCPHHVVVDKEQRLLAAARSAPDLFSPKPIAVGKHYRSGVN
jgi:hypothetical protein